MGGITQVVKALVLLTIGVVGKGFLLSGDNYSFLVHAGYYLVLVQIVYKYAMSYKHSKLPKNDMLVTIVGAGVSGIAMAIKLKEIGVKFRIIEKEKRLGGTWWLNKYPGCECDVPSHLYSYSFYMNPYWSRSHSSHAEILEYLQDAADYYGITRHIEFGKEVQETTWDESSQKWSVTLADGEKFSSNIAVSAIGALIIPVVPTFPGAESFTGEAFHSSKWPQGYDPTGKRVAVIGTGASSVQIVPNIADKVSHISVFQRTPCWVPPKEEFNHPSWLKFLFRVFPALLYLLRAAYFWRGEFLYWGVMRQEGILRNFGVRMMTKHHKKILIDKELAEKMTPNFEPGCKRVTPSNQYLQSFRNEHVSLVTSNIKCFTKNGIETADGKVHEVDTIVYATGFSLLDAVTQVAVFGKNAAKKVRDEAMQNGHKAVEANGASQNGHKSLEDEWGDQPNAYMGITYPGYPNNFFLLGPGTGLGHNTIIFMIECQITYVIDAIKKMVNNNIKSLEVKKETNDKYQAWALKNMKTKVQSSANCASWYKNAAGVIWTLWPSHLTKYWWVTREVDLSEYICK